MAPVYLPLTLRLSEAHYSEHWSSDDDDATFPPIVFFYQKLISSWDRLLGEEPSENRPYSWERRK